MTDGPFKNLKLNRSWKRFAEAVQSDAIERSYNHSLAAHALVHDILSDENKALLLDLKRYAEQEQLELDPSLTVEKIFSSHNNTAFSDVLQKHLAFRLSDQVLPTQAFWQSIEASVTYMAERAKNRIEEECIRAREFGEMRQDQFNNTLVESNKVFNSIPTREICTAVYSCNKSAFKYAASKKVSLDEGPCL